MHLRYPCGRRLVSWKTEGHNGLTGVHSHWMVAIERLAGVDRAWLLMDRPTNPMVVVGLIVLDAELDRERLRDLIAQRFLAFPRFRCIPVPDALGANWIEATQLDPDDHVSCVALPAPAEQAQLETLVGELASTPLPAGRPLWSFHLIEKYRGGSAIVVRVHHCYADGIALVQVLLSLTDDTASAPATPSIASAPADPANGFLSDLLISAFRGGTEVLEKGIHYALHPAEAATLAREALGAAGELVHIGVLPDDPPTRLKRPLSGFRRVAWADPLSLEEVKTMGRVLGCTVNDVLVSTLAGALGRYLESQGDAVAGLTLRAAVPVNLRPGAQGGAPSLGNRFGLVFVELPIGMRHPLERLYAVRAAMQALKNSPQALVTLGLLTVAGSLGSAVEDPALAVFSAKASLVASNLPGPHEPLRLLGASIQQILFWVPQGGSIGTGVSILSYRGQVQFGIMADRAHIPDPTELVKHIAIEFDRLVFLILLGAGSLLE